ncbi:hypothetical protein GCM10007857_44530 [Bradyrhizobium iriomotense]|uniref:Uncharacterized protein n=1 Tax=Bradyrhizobium iriomotense TaxID=441950 RepID=A0ABQ6AZX5_9BRAD|nr:hypothetical protein GCM10007857_44530 [Bradyrhizobium iriomotense]
MSRLSALALGASLYMPCTREDLADALLGGSPLSPLLATLYFRRFLLAWRKHGHQDQLDAHIVNYADERTSLRRR